MAVSNSPSKSITTMITGPDWLQLYLAGKVGYLGVKTGEAVIASLVGRGRWLWWLVGLVQLEQDHHQHQGQADHDHHRYPQQHRGCFLQLRKI